MAPPSGHADDQLSLSANLGERNRAERLLHAFVLVNMKYKYVAYVPHSTDEVAGQSSDGGYFEIRAGWVPRNREFGSKLGQEHDDRNKLVTVR